MASPDEDRILYVDQEEEPSVTRPRSMAMALVVLALVFGIGCLVWEPLNRGPGDVAAASAIKGNRELPTGFDASSVAFTPCDDSRHTLPDFSIVVSGIGGADRHHVVSRVVHLVVVDTYHDYRYGRDTRAPSLCTLQ